MRKKEARLFVVTRTMEKKRKHISAFQQNDKEYDFLCDKVRYDGTFSDSTEAEEFIRVLIGIIDALDPYPMKVVNGKIVDIPTDAVFRRNGGNYEIGKVFEQINTNACWFDKPRKWWKLNLQMYIDKKLWKNLDHEVDKENQQETLPIVPKKKPFRYQCNVCPVRGGGEGFYGTDQPTNWCHHKKTKGHLRRTREAAKTVSAQPDDPTEFETLRKTVVELKNELETWKQKFKNGLEKSPKRKKHLVL